MRRRTDVRQNAAGAMSTADAANAVNAMSMADVAGAAVSAAPAAGNPDKSKNTFYIFSGTPMPSRDRALVSVCKVALVSARRKFLSSSVSAVRILQLK